jgi:hypothetical protein
MTLHRMSLAYAPCSLSARAAGTGLSRRKFAGEWLGQNL